MAQSWKKLASAAYGYSLARLTLNMFLFFDEHAPGKEEENAKRQQMDASFMELVSGLTKGELSAREVHLFRRKVTGETEAVIAFLDCFRIYEYALDRVERRFAEGLPAPDLTEREVAAQVVEYIASAGEMAVMNRRIQDVIGELPVRFTRQKYYGMVHDALSAYIGSDKESLDNMMYLLQTSGMADLSKEQKETYPEILELLLKLSRLSFKELTADSYREAQRQMGLAGERLFALSDYFRMMEEMTNDLYVLALTGDDAVRSVSEEEHACGILKELCALYEGGVWEIPETVEEKLYDLEGIQESCFEKYQRMDPAPEYRDGEDETAFKYRRVERLLSTSAYADLEEESELPDCRVVERQDVETAFDDFVSRIDPVFSSCQKPVMRAIMAITLSRLPVHFHSLDELGDYIGNSLASCADRAEKETCMECLLQLMENEDYGLV